MKAVLDRAAALLLGLFACLAPAMEDSAGIAAVPTVSVFWVIAFMALFVGVCVWIAIAIWRSERRDDPKRQQDPSS